MRRLPLTSTDFCIDPTLRTAPNSTYKMWKDTMKHSLPKNHYTINYVIDAIRK